MITIDEKEIKVITFPNGELGISKDPKYKYVNRTEVEITMLYENQNDLFVLNSLVGYIRDCNAMIEIDLVCPYFPYSRMDRENEDYIFTLKYFSQFINSLNFNKVIIYEPHSDVTPALLNNVFQYDLIENTYIQLLRQLNFSKEKDFILFPDHGAQKRYSKIRYPNILVAHKERDFFTGKIIDYKISGDRNKMRFDSKVLIIDDLCSRGGTFLQAGNELKTYYGVNNVFLYIAHCEENIFTGELLKDDSPIKEIYTTPHSLMIMKQQHSKIKILKEEN